MDRAELATHDPDCIPGRRRVLAFGFLGQQPTANANERKAKLSQHGKGRERSGDSDVEGLSESRVSPDVLRASAHHLDAGQTEGRAGMNEECGFVLVGLDQCQVQVRPRDLEWQAGKASARADVHYVPRLPQVLAQNQAVFDEGQVRAGDQPRPRRNHFRERNQLRIVH